MAIQDEQWLTPPQIAKCLRVKPNKVLGWIRSGELAATDVASAGCVRPRYRVSESWLDTFIQVRSHRGTREHGKVD